MLHIIELLTRGGSARCGFRSSILCHLADVLTETLGPSFPAGRWFVAVGKVVDFGGFTIFEGASVFFWFKGEVQSFQGPAEGRSASNFQLFLAFSAWENPTEAFAALQPSSLRRWFAADVPWTANRRTLPVGMWKIEPPAILIVCHLSSLIYRQNDWVCPILISDPWLGTRWPTYLPAYMHK